MTQVLARGGEWTGTVPSCVQGALEGAAGGLASLWPWPASHQEPRLLPIPKGGCLTTSRLGVRRERGTGAPRSQDVHMLACWVSVGIGQEWPCGGALEGAWVAQSVK